MMKNILLLFAILLTAGLASAQLSIEIDPPTIHGQGGVNEADIAVYVTVTNTSDTKVELLWTRREVEKPEGWLTWICDLNACYTPNVSVAPESRTNVLQRGESMEFQVHAGPNGVAGVASIEVDLYDKSDTSDVLGTVQATFEAGTSSTDDIFDTDAIRVFPNPTSDFFRIYKSDRVAHVEVYSIVGKRVLYYPASIDGQYNVANLPEGMYLVRLLDDRYSVVKTVRLSKS